MNPQIAAGLRRHFHLFLMKVFQDLHPGKPPLTMSWYLMAICHALVDTCEQRGGRMIINVPPRHLKSVAAAVAFPAWMLGKDPSLRIMVATYSEDLARLHSRQFRQIMSEDWYKALFPNTRIADDNNRLLEITTTKMGGRKAVTVGGSVTGHGADIIIIDDCLKAEEARSPARRDDLKSWFDGSLATRLNNLGGGTMICIAQRLHEDDLPAYLLDKGFAHLNLPAIAERDEDVPIGSGQFHHRIVGSLLGHPGFDRTDLERERRNVGPVVFSAMHQQNPVLPGGNLIRPEWFPRFDPATPRHAFQLVIQSWDTGLSDEPTADYSACLTAGWRDDHWHVLDVYRE